MLGVGEDGLPILLDLNDPAPGSVVVIGDERDAQLNMLRMAITSLVTRSTPRAMQILIISYDPQSWQNWVGEHGYGRYCLGIEGAEDLETLRTWILRLADWTEQRRTGERGGPPVLVILDTLKFLTRLSYDVRLNYEWMAKEGPPAQIWQLAAISSELALMLNGRRMLRSFKTRILGYTDKPALYVQLANQSEAEAPQFGQPGQFAVHLGGDWLRFHLPKKNKNS